jgi:small subunit ribosomal protein S25e
LIIYKRGFKFLIKRYKNILLEKKYLTISMGGVKKKTLSSTKATGQQQPADAKTNKPKKEENKPVSRSQKHKSSVIIDDVNDQSILRGMKAITVQSLSKALGVKISIANNYLRNLESKGIIKTVGGYSGHKVYSYNKT